MRLELAWAVVRRSWSVLLATSGLALPAAAAQDEQVDKPSVAVSPATPIIPKPEQPAERAYQLYWEIDLPVLGVAAVLGAARLRLISQRNAPAFCRMTTPEPSCDARELNFIDRPFAGRWEPTWSLISDIGAVSLAVFPVVLLTVDEGLLNMLNDSVVILQSALIATTLSSISSLGTGRPRPFVYDGPDPDEDAPEHVKDSAEGALSFFSGHTAFAFALSTSTFWTVKRRHRRSAYPWIVLGAGTAVAATVATGRIMGGMHFPTDVAGGAIVGSSIGTLVPMLHGTPVIAAPVAGRDRAGVVVHGVF